MGFDVPAISDDGQPRGRVRRKRERWRRRAAWGMSAMVHGIASAAVVAEIALALLFVVPLGGGRRHIELAAIGEPVSLEAEPLVRLPVELPPDPTAADVTDEQIAALAASQISPALAEELLNPQSDEVDSIAAQWVAARVAQEIAAAERTSPEDQFRRLEQLTGTLNDVATEESVKEATARLAQLLNAKPRATEPAAEPPPGEFDIDTAQLYDVKRTDNGRGGFSYVAILLDAEGRTLDSELTEAEGEQLFRTFELMKANPLLARVYRGVVMSLLDKLLRPQSAGQTPAARPLDK
jgi:hypothetical protein